MSRSLRAWFPFRRRPLRPDERSQLRCLLDIADAAVALQPAADEVICACSVADVPGAVIQRGGPIAGAYRSLVRQTRQAQVGPGLEFDRDLLERLLTYHEFMVHEALHMASATAPNRNRAGFRGRLAGLGRPAQRLRDFRDQLGRQLAVGQGDGAPQARP